MEGRGRKRPGKEEKERLQREKMQKQEEREQERIRKECREMGAEVFASGEEVAEGAHVSELLDQMSSAPSSPPFHFDDDRLAGEEMQEETFGEKDEPYYAAVKGLYSIQPFLSVDFKIGGLQDHPRTVLRWLQGTSWSGVR